MPRLDGKVVLLSGGASGIGAATARMVVREGGKAVLADRDEAKGRELARELGTDAHFVPHDVVQEPSWQAAVAATITPSATAASIGHVPRTREVLAMLGDALVVSSVLTTIPIASLPGSGARSVST